MWPDQTGVLPWVALMSLAAIAVAVRRRSERVAVVIRTVEILLIGFGLGVILGAPLVYWLSFEFRLGHRVTGRPVDLVGVRPSGKIVELDERRVGA